MKTKRIILPLFALIVPLIAAFAANTYGMRMPGEVNAYYFSLTPACGNVQKICCTTGTIICEELGTGVDLYGRSASGCTIALYECD